MKKKFVDIIKLEDRVLFDAAAAADIIEAAEAQAAAQQVSESDAKAAEERDALKNAPPESPVADQGAQAGVSQDPAAAADVDAAVNAIVDGDIPQDGADADADAQDGANADAADVASGNAGDIVDQVDDMAGNDVDQAVDDFINHDSADQTGDAQDVGFVEAFQAPAFEERELVIINSSVKDADKIIAALGENTDVLYLEKGTDALDAINDFLDANSNVKYSAIHIVSHGNAGYFVLNGEVIDGESVAKDPASWANIGEHLTDDGDIMLYACNLAGNEQGQLLVSQIAGLTGADVAASVDSTGVHGNWDLEYSIGAIDNQFLNVGDYNYSLANVTLTVDGTGTNPGSFQTFDDAYHFAINGSDEYTIDIQINNAFASELDNSESITITGNGLVVNDSTVTGDLTFSNSSVTLAQTTDFSGIVSVNNLALQGSVTTSGSGVLTINGVLSGSGDITFDGSTVLAGSNASVNMTDGTITYDNVYASNNGMLQGTYQNLTLGTSSVDKWSTTRSMIINGAMDAGNVGSLLLAGAVQGNGSVTNAAANTVYFSSNILSGSYHTLTLATANISAGNVTADALVMQPGTSLAVSAGSFTVNELAGQSGLTDASGNRFYVTGGTLELNLSNTKTIQSSFFVTDGTLNLNVSNASFSNNVIGNGGTAVINIGGNGATFNSNVGLSRSGGTMNITGSNLVFNMHVSNALGWYNTSDLNGYNPIDNTSYVTDSGNKSVTGQAGEDLTAGNYEGTINVSSSGNVLFNGQVVSTGAFNINSGTITFSATRLVAAAAGTFSINGGTVNFLGNVYVSTMFNGDLAGTRNEGKTASGLWDRSTVFSVNGGEVNFSADLVNWVRTYRGGQYTIDSTKYAYGDMGVYTYNNADYGGLEFRRSVSSSVLFSGGTTTFGANSTYKAYGTFGNVYTYVGAGAAVKFNDVRAFNLDAYTPTTNVYRNGTTITWSSEWAAEYGHSNPFTSTIQGVKISGITNNEVFEIQANGTLTVAGDVISSGDSDFGRAQFYLLGNSNEFNGAFSNANGAWMEIRGEGNSFYSMTNSSGGDGSAFLYVYEQSNFTTLNNSGSLYVTDAGAVQIENFTNSGGETTISGDNTGMSFTRTINISSGNVRLSSALGVDISAAITLGGSAVFEVTGANTFTGDISNSGTFNIAGRGVNIKGGLTNNASGLISINGSADPDYSTLSDLTAITGKLTNAGTININQAGLVFNALGMGFTNSGKLSIGKYTIFNNLTNTSSGTLEFTKTTGTTRGSEGSVFVNLNNAGSLTVSVDNIIFSDGLTNSGTLRISGANVRFIDMVSESGALTFVNTASGKIYLTAANTNTQRVDIDNRGTVEVNGSGAGMTYYFGLVNNSGSMYANNLATIDIGGALVNSGSIYGEGNLTLRAATTGDGTLTFTSGTVTYSYADADAVTLDADGFYRINGVVVGDAYSNRPEYVDGVGWCYNGGTTPITALANLGKFANISINSSGSWVVGGVNTSIALSSPITAPVIGANGFWQFEGKDTAVAVTVNQTVYGGSIYNMTIQGDAVVDAAGTKGVTLASGATLQITGTFYNNNVQMVVAGSIAFNNTYRDTNGSSLRIADGGVASFNVQTKDSTTQRFTASILGSVINDGKINVANGQELIFTNVTTGSGSVSAGSAVVTFNDVAVSGGYSQSVFSGNYQYLNLIGYSKTLDNGTVVVDTLNNAVNPGQTLAITNGSNLTVNGKVTGNGNFDLGSESLLTFNSKANGAYSIAGNITVADTAFGLAFNGNATGKITVNGTVSNAAVSGSNSESRRFGVTAGNTAFAGQVTNSGTFTVENNGVTFADFILNANSDASLKSELVLDIGAGNGFDFGTTNMLTANGGQVTVRSGEVAISAAAIGSAAVFDLASGSMLTLNADGLTLAQLTVANGATVNVLAGATVGAAGNTSAGLKLDGALNVTGGTLTVYAFSTTTPTKEGTTAAIYIGNGATLNFVDGQSSGIDYGDVYANVEIAGGTLTGWESETSITNSRLMNVTVDDWIVVDGVNANTSDWNKEGLKFLVINGGTLTVDSNSEVAYRIQSGSSLVISINTTVTGAVTVEDGSTITVNTGATITFAGSVTALGANVISGEGSVVFNGPVITTDGISTGTINMSNGSIVTYGSGAGDVLFAGNYGTLVVNNTASVGDVTILTALLGTGKVTFNGATGGAATVGDTSLTGTLSVTYGSAATTIYAGRYNNLTFEGSRTLNAGNTTSLDITVDGTMAITGGSSTSPVTLTLHNTNLVLNGAIANSDSARIAVSGTLESAGTVIYNSDVDQTIYSGSYRKLVINGAGTQTVKSLNVAMSLTSDGAGTLVVSNAIGGSGTVGTAAAGVNVSYGAAITSGYLGGYYGNLTIGGTDVKTIANDLNVSGTIQNNAVLTGTGNLVFAGSVIGTGSIGNADNVYAGNVTYSQTDAAATQKIYGGYYTNLTLAGNKKSVTSAVDVANTLQVGNAQLLVSANLSANKIAAGSSVTDFRVSANATLEFDSVSGNTSNLTFNNLGTLKVNGSYTFGSSLTNSGTISIGNGGNVTVTADAALQGSTVLVVADGGTLTLNSLGSAATAQKFASIANAGTININGGNLTVAGSISGEGDVSQFGSSTLELAGTGTLNGMFTLAAGSNLNVTGQIRLNHLTTAGTITVGSATKTGASLVLYEVNAGDAASTSVMSVNNDSTLQFVPFTVFQMIGGKVNIGKTGTLTYDPAWTGFYNTPTSYWITISADTTYDLGDLSADHGYKIADGATLTLSTTVIGSISSEFWIMEGGTLAFADAASAIDTALSGNITNHGSISVGANRGVNFTGGVYVDNTVTGDADSQTGIGTMNAVASSTVSYNTNGALVFAGSYGNLNLNGNYSVTNLALAGTLGGAGSLTLTGVASGSGSVDGLDMTYTQSASGSVFGGTYANLTLVGSKTLGGTVTVTGLLTASLGTAESAVISGSGTLNVDGTLSVASGVTLNHTGTVVYGAGFNGSMFNGSYRDLTMNGQGTVGDVSISGTISGDGLLVLTGAANGGGTVSGGTLAVSYSGTPGEGVTYYVYGGEYGALQISGARTLAGATSVAGIFNLPGTLTGSSSLTLNGLVTGAGSVNMTGGAVTYAATSTGYILGGTYAGLTIEDNGQTRYLTSDFTVSGAARLNGEFAGSSALTITFNGTTSGNASFNLSQATVVYGEQASVIFGGRIYNLTLAGSKSFATDLQVDGTATFGAATYNILNGVTLSLNLISDAEGTKYMIRQGGTVNFTGINVGTTDKTGDGILGEVNNYGTINISGKSDFRSVINYAGGQITFSNNPEVALGEFYNYGTIELNSSKIQFTTFWNYGELIVNVQGEYSFTDKQKLVNSGSVTVNSGRLILDAFEEGDTGSKSYVVNAGTLSFTTADLKLAGSVTIAAGAYLKVDGSVTFNGAVVNDGSINGSGTATFNSSTTGSGTVTGEVNATYSEYAMTIYSGTYGDLTLTGGGYRTLAGSLTINGKATFSGTITTATGTTAVLKFNGTTEGSATVQGSIIATYADTATNVYGGEYLSLTLIGSKTIDLSLTVNGSFQLQRPGKEAVKLSGAGNLIFNGYVGFTDGDTIENTALVEYNGSGSKILDGVYKNLVVNGNRSVGNITLNGTLSGNGLIQFTGTTTAGTDATVAGISAWYGEKATVVFSGTYSDLTLKGSKTLSGEKITVNGDLTALQTDKGATTVISGSAELVVNGKLNNFVKLGNDNLGGQFSYDGKITLNGSLFSVVSSTFNGALVVNGSGLTFTSATFNGEVSGTGSMRLAESVAGSGSFNMKEGSSVTYEAKVQNHISGTYYDLAFEANSSNTTRTISNLIRVNGTLTVDGAHKTFTVAEGGHLIALQISDTANTVYKNYGTITFGSDLGTDKVGTALLTQTINGSLNNYATVNVTRGNYSFNFFFNHKGATFTVDAKQGGIVLLSSFENAYTANAVFDTTTVIAELATTGWVNYGNLTLNNFSNFGFAAGTQLAFTNATGATLTIGGAKSASYYVFDTTVRVANGGTIGTTKGGNIVFNDLIERIGGSIAYVTNGGSITFDITNPSSQVLNDGIRGTLSINGGTMNLNTANMKYYGNVSLDGNETASAYLNINQRSIFEGNVLKNNLGVITVAASAANTAFQGTVNSGSAFIINGSTTFAGAVSVANQFIINAATVFNDKVTVSASDGQDSTIGDANTIFLINAATIFNGDFVNQNVTQNKVWNSVVLVNATTKFNGSVTNSSNGDNHVAEFRVFSNGNVFNKVTNTGAAAKFLVYSSGNAFKGTVTNTTGLFELNGVNNLGDVVNTGYLRINNAASGSSFGAITNSGRIGVFAGEKGEATDIDFNKAVTNSGTFTIEAEGVNFKQAVTNSGTFNVMAATLFRVAVVNSGEFNIKGSDTTFTGSVENTGNMTVAQNVTGVTFNGAYTLGANAHLYLNGANTVFNGAFNNSGTIHVTGNDGEAGNGNIINGVLTMNAGSLIEVGATGELTLNVVTDSADSTMTVADGGILRFVKQTTVQDIYSHIVVSGDGDVLYTPGWTIFHNIDYLDWIVISSNVTVTDLIAGEKYRVVNGGVLTVNGSAAGSLFKVTDGGQLIFNENVTDVGTVSITAGGSATVNSGTFANAFSNEGGTVNVNGNGVSFADYTAINGTTNVNGSSVTFTQTAINGGAFNVNGANASFGTFVNHSGELTVNGNGAKFTELNNDGNLIVNGSNVAFDQLYNGWFDSDKQIKYTGNTVINGQNITVGGGLNIGSLTISKGASVTLTEFSDRYVNQSVVPLDEYFGTTTVAGTVTLDAGQFLEFGFAGTVIADGGTFISNSDIRFTGATSGSADFSQTALVSYGGWMGQDQTIIAGTYNNLTIAFGGAAFPAEGSTKTVEGTVTVNGAFALEEQGEIVIGANGVLNLNTIVQTGSEGGYTNNGTVNFNKADQTVNGVFANNGTIGINASNIAFANLLNTGSVAVNADDVALNLANNTGSIIVNGNNAQLTGGNADSAVIVINGQNANMGMTSLPGVQITVNGSMNLLADAVDNGTLHATVTNNGTVSILATVTSFAGGFTNSGTMDIATGAAGSNLGNVKNTAEGLITVHAANVNLSGLDHAGRVELYDATAVVDNLKNNGTLALHVESVDFSKIDNTNGIVELNADYVLSQDKEVTGTVVNNKTLTLTDSVVNGNYANNGTLNFAAADATANGDIANAGTINGNALTFSGSLNNDGTINIDSGVFLGATAGNGSVNADTALYADQAQLVYGGNYGDLNVQTAASVLNGVALVGGTTTLDGKLTVNGQLNVGGDTAGNGSIAGGTGTVIYSANGDQEMFNGQYNNLILSGSGDKTLENGVISGNATRQDGTTFTAGTVNYNGTGIQHTIAGSYQNLIISGSGTKLMEGGGLYSADNFTANGGNWSNMISIKSDNGSRWMLDAGSTNIHYMSIADADSTKPIYLDGTNLTGPNVSNQWRVFDSAGGIGDSFPSLGNLNFTSLAAILGEELRGEELEVLYSQGDIFFRRRIGRVSMMPTDEVSSALESAPNFVDSRLQYDEAVFEEAEFSDQDYSDILDVADIFSSELEAAIDNLVTE